MTRGLLFNMIAVGVFLIGLFFIFHYFNPISSSSSQPQKNQLSAASVSQTASTTPPSVASTVATSSATSTVVQVQKAKTDLSKAAISTSTSTSTDDEITRIQDPYDTPPESFTDINTVTREALVNILCQPEGASSLDPISGSGVIIDPRGIILTNAHVAQYVLLSEAAQVDLTCVIRTGSPAQSAWTAAVLYIPPVWVNEHASEILEEHPTGTGEHDYALLYITGSTTETPLPTEFPYLSVDTRPGIAFPGDQVLVASYPAEFVGGIAAEYDLYADSSVTSIQQLLTFATGTPDVQSLGGIIEAQSGSSGGAVVNAWGRLVGIVTTTSSGTTTADRDLYSISLSYINSDIAAQSGSDLDTLLNGDPASETEDFTRETAPGLISTYIGVLNGAQNQ